MAQQARGRAVLPRVDLAAGEEDAVAAHHVAGVIEKFRFQAILGALEDEQHRHAFLDEQVAQGIGGAAARAPHVLFERHPAQVAVVAPGHPGKGDLGQVHRLQAALEALAQRRIGQLAIGGEHAVIPDLQWQQVLEHGRRPHVWVDVEREVHLVDGDQVDVVDERLDLGCRVALQMGDVHGHAGAPADLHRFLDAFQGAARIAHVRHIDALFGAHAQRGCGQLVGAGETLVDVIEPGREAARAVTHAGAHQFLDVHKLVVVGVALAKAQRQRAHVGVGHKGRHILRTLAVEQRHIVGNALPAGVLLEAQTVERAQILDPGMHRLCVDRRIGDAVQHEELGRKAL